MPRTRHVPARRKRRKKWLKQAKGYVGGRRKLYRQARETVERAGAYAYRDRRVKKRTFRNLWIARINAGCRAHDLSYSKFVAGLKKAKVTLDRKSLADICANDAPTFEQLVQLAKAA